ncbi:MAG: DUF4396 domain-containing protein [Bryobacteraceae bacterium]
MPEWLILLAIASIAMAAVSFAVIAVELTRHPQKMWIMNVVWPLTALYGGPIAVYAYFKAGRLSSKESVEQAKKRGEENPGKAKPFWQIVGVGVTHCGSGCTLGDILAEWIVFAAPITIFGQKMFGSWVLDFVFAYLLGVAFQYFTITPMKNLPPGEGLWAAIKADTLSLTAWQVGMYGWMAVSVFLIFGHEIPKTSPVFWFMMQIAMLVGFVTSYPVNWWLIRKGVKEAM